MAHVKRVARAIQSAEGDDPPAVGVIRDVPLDAPCIGIRCHQLSAREQRGTLVSGERPSPRTDLVELCLCGCVLRASESR